jgi:hypothetical protein
MRKTAKAANLLTFIVIAFVALTVSAQNNHPSVV